MLEFQYIERGLLNSEKPSKNPDKQIGTSHVIAPGIYKEVPSREECGQWVACNGLSSSVILG